MKSNQNLAKTFRAARKLIEAGDGEGGNRFICTAITKASFSVEISYDDADRAMAVIHDRLDGKFTIEEWVYVNVLGGNRVQFNSLNSEVFKEYRLRWLDALIAEFE